MKTSKGFSLVELIIVIAIIGILASISSFAWQRHVNNANLRTAARDLVSDFQNCKQNAIKESRDYHIEFTTGTNGSYTISAATTTSPATYAAVNTTKSPTTHGNGIQITSASFFGIPSNKIRLEVRGTSTNGTVVMENSRGSKATIKTNTTGKAYVQFEMH